MNQVSSLANPPALLQQLASIAHTAGEAIMDIWKGGEYNTVYKTDQSPVTAADYAADQIIRQGLAQLEPVLPVLSEEQEPGNRRDWQAFWLVDPLDGTREFVDGIPEFTVNIAQIARGQPVAGIIYVPGQQIAYVFGQPASAWKGRYSQQGWHWTKLQPSQPAPVSRALKIVVSRRVKADEQPAYDAFTNRLQQQGYITDIVQAGSAYKFCLMADGKADLYPRFHPTCEWDTAAGQGLLEVLGGGLVAWPTGKSFTYGQRSTLVNGGFIATTDRTLLSHIKV